MPRALIEAVRPFSLQPPFIEKEVSLSLENRREDSTLKRR